jgi:hypothetical protein
VYAGLIGTSVDGEPFPYMIEGTVLAIHDEFVRIHCPMEEWIVDVKRERVITMEQAHELKKRYLGE